MKRAARILGILGGVLMIAMGAMHSLIGWGEFRETFANAHVPAKLTEGLAVPWQFTGAAMVACGIITIWTLSAPARERTPVILIGVMYVLFAGFTVTAIHFDITFFLFFLPGALALIGGLVR